MKISKARNFNKAALLGLVATLGIILYVRANEPRRMPLLHLQTATQPSPRAARISRQRFPAIRRIYGHSIVPGGIHSVEELKRAIVADPTAAQHYARFDVTKAYITRLPHDGRYYLSYRLNDGIHFTSVLRLIRGGEEVLTDGNSYILTRCGNEIATSIDGPVDVAQEPMDLDIIVAELPPASGPTPDSTPVLTPDAIPPASSTLPPDKSSVGDGGAPPTGGGPSPAYDPPVFGADPPLGGSGMPPQISADDLSLGAELSLLIVGLSAILAWKLLIR